jgi:prepilin-type N-terminal cleavage/methylation domain-containing protein
MKRVRRIRGFTLLEILTAMAIVAIMIGLLIPAIGMVEKTAKTVKQKSQFHAIEIALEAFRTDWGDYPPSSYTVKPTAGNPTGTASSGLDTGYCGAQKLAEALIGWDGFGFHPKSQWRADGLEDTGTGEVPLYFGLPVAPTLEAAPYTDDDRSNNLKARKGPYLELEKANAVKLGSLYLDTSGMFAVAAKNTYVLCDMFGVVKNSTTGKKTGMPILYFRADTAKSYWKPKPLTNRPWDTGTDWDAIYNVNENYPFLMINPPWGDISHPMSNRNVFYDRIKNPNYPGTLANEFKDARPYRGQTFILLSAGADGLYGTSDDVYNIDENEK